MGRHTYATTCINSGISIEVLAQMMGHTDIRTTQIYAKMVNKTVENAYVFLDEIEFTKVFVNKMCEIIVMLCRLIISIHNINKKRDCLTSLDGLFFY